MKTLLINLDRSADRLARIREDADRVGLKLERVTAVEGGSLPSNTFRQFTFNPAMSKNEMGCYASHLLCAMNLRESKAEYALIIEDDAHFADDVVAAISQAIDSAPLGWDLILLANEPDRAVVSLMLLPCDRQLIRYSRVTGSAAGYLLSRTGAEKFLSKSYREWLNDGDFREGWQFDLDIYGVSPPPIWQASHESTIMHAPVLTFRVPTLGERIRCERWTAKRLGTVAYIACYIANFGYRLRYRMRKRARKRLAARGVARI